jgi:hypothetical protein|tara:strand:- start:1079 stop:1309 length:231 start_codon:yes stop_codon:yes gene_type:complete
MTHLMEVAPDYFKQVENVVKNYILVKNVRPYDHGDTLVLQDATNTKSELLLTITSVDKNVNGLKSDYCILSFKLIS